MFYDRQARFIVVDNVLEAQTKQLQMGWENLEFACLKTIPTDVWL
mgnify:CR=1 FL=1